MMVLEQLSREQLEEALPLVWEVFCRYEAVEYPEDGKAAFWNAIHSADYLDSLTAFGAFDGDRLIGILATREEGSHIALFFVDGDYHRRGIGRRLMERCLAENEHPKITVHSSEYAVGIYRSLGFVQSGDRQEDSGIRFVPMVLERRGLV